MDLSKFRYKGSRLVSFLFLPTSALVAFKHDVLTDSAGSNPTVWALKMSADGPPKARWTT